MLRGSNFLTALLIWASTIRAAPGDLDATYDGDGIAITSLTPGSDQVLAVALQHDGKLVCAGYATVPPDQFAVARFNLDGSLDTTFSGDGKVITSVTSSNSYGEGVVIQPDGKIIVGGYAHTGTTYDFAVVRYHADGNLDTTFGNGGKVITPIGSGHDQCYGLALQPDGKIVLVGSAMGDAAVVRYLPDGSLDESFGSGGTVRTDFGGGADFAGQVVLQPDGRIVVAGYSRISTTNDYDFMVARLNADGSLDSSFSGDGKVITPVGPTNDFAWAMALQPDGKILVAGKASNGSDDDFAVVRYLTNGVLDAAFEGDGRLTFPVGAGNEWVRDIAVQGDGKILLAGASIIGSTLDVALARRNANGSPDASFYGGVVITPIGSSSDSGYAMEIQCDGKIVLGALTWTGSGYDFAALRYESGWLPPPNISVELPSGEEITSGTGVNFGCVTVGTNAAWTFTARNSGGTNLADLAASVDGPHASDFTVVAPSTTSLAPYATNAWVVTLAPGTPGDRNATLHIGSNDPDEDPFDIALNGTGITALEAWRLRHFGCMTNQGVGADGHDYEPDGVPNLMEFATDGNPRQYGPIPASLAPSGESLLFVYTRNQAAIGELSFIVEWSDTLLPDDWHTDGVSEINLPGDEGPTQRVQVTLPRGTGSARFVRLRVTRP